MLVLSRTNGQKLWIGNTCLNFKIQKGRVKVYIEADKETIVLRDELKQRGNKRGNGQCGKPQQ